MDKYGVLVAHLVVVDPEPRSGNWEGTREDYFVFKKNGHAGLVEISSRSPIKVMPVDSKTPTGAETWRNVSKLAGDVAALLKDA